FKAMHPPFREVSFEEVKLILALAWQSGRWDGRDGGLGLGYGAVLETMAGARRYENEDEVISALNFIEDVRGKHAEKEEVFMDRRKCAGMVLDAMNFVEKGL
ncbi:MAG: hypothetical protein JZU63_13750, partial [Rhodoferax sp.]|nr:hypothetical protein [Rhodoferax sp.]